MPQRHVDLTEHFDQFLDAGVESGKFGNASEMAREGLRLLEQREREDQARIEGLRNAARYGFDAFKRGDFVTLDSDEDMAAFVSGLRGDDLARAS